MSNNLSIRLVSISDAAELLKIYAPYVLQTSFTPESQIPSLKSFQDKINQTIPVYPYLVCIMNEKIVGYACAHKYRQASGHQWSVETSVYCAQDMQGKGIASKLYKTFFEILKLQNFINVFAGIILPNDRSVAFHQKFNFTKVGIFEKGIYKSGVWHDVLWMQLALCPHPKNPSLPVPLPEIIHTESFKKIMAQANDQHK